MSKPLNMSQAQARKEIKNEAKNSGLKCRIKNGVAELKSKDSLSSDQFTILINLQGSRYETASDRCSHIPTDKQRKKVLNNLDVRLSR